MTITSDQLTELLSKAAEQGALRAMEKTGLANPIITYAQAKREIGETDARKARISPSINWRAKGAGSLKCGVFCLRSEFDKWNMNREFEGSQNNKFAGIEA